MDLKILRIALVWMSIWLMVSCRQRPAQDELGQGAARTTQQVYSVKGVVKEIKIDEHTAIIEHEAVPDYMPAMTMPFKVKATNELRGLQPGDAVSFLMVVTP